ncbi:MAG: hypothetical protein MI923_09865 [Phycisphaerales bacterium]|nr:hypothetical protein [Phycisphaerales bacterium]
MAKRGRVAFTRACGSLRARRLDRLTRYIPMRPCCPLSRLLRRSAVQVGQSRQSVGQLAYDRVRVTVHCQGDGRMPRELLGHLRMNAAACEVRDERMPQRVKVQHALPIVAVGKEV